RIQTSAGPESDRHIGNHVLLDGFLEQKIQLLFGGAEAPGLLCRGRGRAAPVRLDLRRAALPDEEVSGKEFLNSLDKGKWRGNIVYAEIAIQSLQVQAAIDIGVVENPL